MNSLNPSFYIHGTVRPFFSWHFHWNTAEIYALAIIYLFGSFSVVRCSSFTKRHNKCVCCVCVNACIYILHSEFESYVGKVLKKCAHKHIYYILDSGTTNVCSFWMSYGGKKGMVHIQKWCESSWYRNTKDISIKGARKVKDMQEIKQNFAWTFLRMVFNCDGHHSRIQWLR